MKINWPSGRLMIPRIRVRVVCGFSETAAICSPTRALRSVDLPELGRPIKAAEPVWKVGETSLIGGVAVP
jgi:hypothetical protein